MRMAAATVASGGVPGASEAFCGLRRGAPTLFDESFEAWDQFWCVSTFGVGLVSSRRREVAAPAVPAPGAPLGSVPAPSAAAPTSLISMSSGGAGSGVTRGPLAWSSPRSAQSLVTMPKLANPRYAPIA